MLFLGNITIINENLVIQQKGSIFCITLWFGDAMFLNFFIYKSSYVSEILVVVNIIYMDINFYQFTE